MNPFAILYEDRFTPARWKGPRSEPSHTQKFGQARAHNRP